jgi:hypothetical protein
MTAAASIFKGKAAGAADTPADGSEVRRALALLADPAAGVQLRVLPSGRTAVFPAADLAAAAAWVEREQAGAAGVYYGLNPVPPDLGRPPKVADVLRRRWLLVDVDPARPDPDASASEAEHDLARNRANQVAETLSGMGLPVPVLIDSGNGWHLLYRVDLPNDPASRELLKLVLAELAVAFDDERVAVDRKVYDAPRIAKLPGTWARKGPGTPERPHRPCRLVAAPAEPAVVTEAQLRALLPAAPAAPAAGEPPLAGAPRRSVFAARAAGADEDARGAAYARSALHREVGRVATTRAGERNDALNKAAFALGQLVAGGLLARGEVEEALSRAAIGAGLAEGEIRATLRSGLEAGAKEPRSAPEPAGRPERGRGSAPAARERPRPETHTLTELLAMDIPEPRWAVPGLLSEGLTILAGKPKIGKSWLALNLAITIAGGGTALGMAKVVPGDVLYLALEDRLRRVQARAKKLLRGLDCAASDRLQIATAWPRLDDGGAEFIDEWAAAVERPALVVIDVWAKFRPVYEFKGSQYDQDYQHGAAIKEVADRRGLSVLPLHHTKKAAAEDIVDDVSGTLGIAGAADGLTILTRARGENEGRIFVTGRDVDERELAVAFDPATFAWRVAGDAAEHSRSKVRQAVIRALRGADLMTYTETADLCDLDRDVVRKEMWRMVQDGTLQKSGSKYRLAPEPDF